MDDVPVVQSYRFSRAGVEETFALPQLQLVDNFDGHQHPCLGAFVKTIETPQLQFLDTVIDVPVVQVHRFCKEYISNYRKMATKTVRIQQQHQHER